MSTATLARPGLPRLAAVELRKSADTRAGFWLLLVIVLLAVAVVVLQSVFAEDEIDRTFEALLRSATEVVALILPVLGILLVTSEWSQRTGLTTFALVPTRGRVVVAKIVGATILALFAMAACVVVAAVGNVFTGGDWDLGLGQLGRLGLYELIGMLGGVAFGLALLSSPLAIVLYFVIPIGWSILGETISALDKPADWLDLSRPMMLLVEGDMTGTAWAQLGTATAVWVGLVMAIGVARLHRAELK